MVSKIQDISRCSGLCSNSINIPLRLIEYALSILVVYQLMRNDCIKYPGIVGICATLYFACERYYCHVQAHDRLTGTGARLRHQLLVAHMLNAYAVPFRVQWRFDYTTYYCLRVSCGSLTYLHVCFTFANVFVKSFYTKLMYVLIVSNCNCVFVSSFRVSETYFSLILQRFCQSLIFKPTTRASKPTYSSLWQRVIEATNWSVEIVGIPKVFSKLRGLRVAG